MFNKEHLIAVCFAAAAAITTPAFSATTDVIDQPENCISSTDIHGSKGVDWQRSIVEGRASKITICSVTANVFPEKGPDSSFWEAPEPAGTRKPNGRYLHK